LTTTWPTSSAEELKHKSTIATGKHNTVVEEWDYCGGASFTPVAITVNNQSGVWITSPANNAGVNTPVTYAATATHHLFEGVASMGILCQQSIELRGRWANP